MRWKRLPSRNRDGAIDDAIDEQHGRCAVSLTFLAAFIILIALVFDYTNGFHDSANAIATSVSTRALTPHVALAMAAVLNIAGALISTKVAATIGGGIIDPPVGRAGLVIVLAALLGAIAWNLLTWWFGLPSSSSHALIGGLVGAALSASSTVHWPGVVQKVVLPMVISPVLAMVVAYPLMLIVMWLFRNAGYHRAVRGFRWAQVASAATMAFSHGTQDAQKTMGVIALTLIVSGQLSVGAGIPTWVILASAAAMALGTYSGGWRIMRTVGRRIYALTPVSGFTAEASASAIMLTAAHFGFPISTTHVISTSIMGVGATKRFSAVRWGVAGNIVTAWVLTIPAAAAVAAALSWLLNQILL
jgi:inorganic phosphate transporter, PiT family